jgi:hypothetical protein
MVQVVLRMKSSFFAAGSIVASQDQVNSFLSCKIITDMAFDGKYSLWTKFSNPTLDK